MHWLDIAFFVVIFLLLIFAIVWGLMLWWSILMVAPLYTVIVTVGVTVTIGGVTKILVDRL